MGFFSLIRSVFWIKEKELKYLSLFVETIDLEMYQFWGCLKKEKEKYKKK